jgi:hypothetical protein
MVPPDADVADRATAAPSSSESVPSGVLPLDEEEDISGVESTIAALDAELKGMDLTRTDPR